MKGVQFSHLSDLVFTILFFFLLFLKALENTIFFVVCQKYSCFLTAASCPKKDFYNPPPPKNVKQTFVLHTQNSTTFLLRTQKSVPKSMPKKGGKKAAKKAAKKFIP